MMSDPAVLTGWLGVLALLGVVLACAPWLARRGATTDPSPSVDGSVRDRGGWVVVTGVLHVLSAPLALVLAFGRLMSWDSSSAHDTAGTVLVLANVPVGLVCGVALVVVGMRLRSGAPTTGANGAAVALFGAWMLATGVAITLEPSGALGLGVAVLVLVALSAAGASMMGARSVADRGLARRRAIGSDLGIATILSSTGATVLWFAAELDDRLGDSDRAVSSHAFYVVMLSRLIGAGVLFIVGSLVAAAAAIATWREPR
jgi:hypothetical protein